MAGFLGNQPPKVPLTSADIADGTITNADIDSVSATKLTGSIADARVPASAVTQHVTGYDDSNIKADILKLAISQAVDGNRVAFNLTDSFIDGFEDDTGITTETNVDRNTTNEYVSSAIISSSLSSDLCTGGTALADSNESAHPASHAVDNSTSTYWISNIGSSINGISYVGYDLGAGNDVELRQFTILGRQAGSNGNWMPSVKVRYSDNGSSWTNHETITLSTTYSTTKQTLAVSAGGGSHRYWTLLANSNSADGSSSWGVAELEFMAYPITVNATGTLISDAQTASSSRTSCSGVIVYEDASGTATLGTDLKIYFTANNGSNWTEASSYATAVTYSGTKKLVTLGSTTVTSGTQIAIKAEWANQSSGSKETRLHGWAVNY